MELLTYLLKVSACTVLFFAFYLLVLRRLTFFKINRFYLLITLVLSFIIPTFNFTIEREVAATEVLFEPTIVTNQAQIAPVQPISQIASSPIVEESFDWYAVLPYLYFGIVVSLLLIATWRILKLVKHTKNGLERINGLKIVSKTKGFTNCSFFNYVFIDNENLTKAELQVLLKHEQVHAKQLHSIDKVLLIIAKAFLWFNPVVYLYDKALEQAHEYEADETTSQSFGTEQYANLLLRLAIAKSEMPLVHNFVKSPIKARIKMLFNSKSKNMKKLIYLLAVPIGLGLLWGFTVKVVEITKSPEPKNAETIDEKTKTIDSKLWGKTLKGKVKSILQTEVGEVLNFEHDKRVIRVFNYSKDNVSVGDEIFIRINGTVEGISITDAKGNIIKQLDSPCYGMDMMKTLDGKVLFDLEDKPFIFKGANMEFGKYKSERIVLNTVNGRILSVKIVHGTPDNQPSKIFIYNDGKLYNEEETLKFDKNFIAKLSEKRGFSKSSDYSIPTLVNEKDAYVFWFGSEPKLAVQTSKSRSYFQKYNGKTIDGQIVELTYSPTTKVMDGFLIKTAAGEILKANVEAKFADLTKTMVSKGNKINVKIYNANYIPNSAFPLLTSYRLMKDGKLLYDRWPKVAVNQLTPSDKTDVAKAYSDSNEIDGGQGLFKIQKDKYGELLMNVFKISEYNDSHFNLLAKELKKDGFLLTAKKSYKNEKLKSLMVTVQSNNRNASVIWDADVNTDQAEVVIETNSKTKQYAIKLITHYIEKPRLLSSKGLKVNKKSQISYITNGVMQISFGMLTAEEMIWDTNNQSLKAKKATIKFNSGQTQIVDSLYYNAKTDKGVLYGIQKEGFQKPESNSAAYELLSNLKIGTDSVKVRKVFNTLMLSGKVKLNIDNSTLTAKVLKAEKNSNLIIAHLATLTSADGSKIGGDVIEYDVVSKKATIANPIGSLYKR
ncbi:MAG: M56 family metallopeptidase [Pedobacter sp.]|nr:MAG: M56 family metallopeptidase [Pedobacter sp.]